MVYNHISLGKNLKRIRKNRNISVAQLSKQAGSSESALRSVEAGHRYFSIQRLCAVANIFNISIDELLVECEEDAALLNELYSLYAANPYTELINQLDNCDDKEIIFLLDTLKILNKLKEEQPIVGEMPDTN